MYYDILLEEEFTRVRQVGSEVHIYIRTLQPDWKIHQLYSNSQVISRHRFLSLAQAALEEFHQISLVHNS